MHQIQRTVNGHGKGEETHDEKHNKALRACKSHGQPSQKNAKPMTSVKVKVKLAVTHLDV